VINLLFDFKLRSDHLNSLGNLFDAVSGEQREMCLITTC